MAGVCDGMSFRKVPRSFVSENAFFQMHLGLFQFHLAHILVDDSPFRYAVSFFVLRLYSCGLVRCDI